MKILYVGDSSPSSTSRHRADALVRLGHEVSIADPFKALSDSLKGYRWAIHWRMGFRLVQRPLLTWIKSVLSKENNIDVIWVNGGELLGPKSVAVLRGMHKPVILYNNDDPTGSRDGHRFDSLIRALPFYDLCVIRPELNSEEYYVRGAKKVLRIWLSYDEVVHAPAQRYEPMPRQFISDVCFVGTCIPREKRGEFLLALKKRGLDPAIWGDKWHQSSTWGRLKSSWRGPSIHGRDYVSALCGAKICLGLLSKGNRNLHTQRSVEIPYAGGLFCAERTSEHMKMYKEDEEAVFWSDANECAEKCLELLADPAKRERIRLAGMKRVRENKVGNEDACRTILECLKADQPGVL